MFSNFKFQFIIGLSYFSVSLSSSILESFDPTEHTDPNCFQTLEVLEDVDEETKESEYVIQSPGNELEPHVEYPDNLACGWHIKGNNGTGIITLNFDYFNIEKSKGCLYDRMILYKQSYGQDWWDQINKYCGYHQPFTIEIAVESFYIYFVTDSSISGLGFNATFSIVYPKVSPVITCLHKMDDATCKRTVHVYEFSTVKLYCNASGSPLPVMHWKKWTSNGTSEGIISDISDHIIQSVNYDGELVLGNLERKDSGFYQCSARNKHGSMKQNLKLVVEERCVCPKNIELSWYDFPPYTPYVTGYIKWRTLIMKGIFYEVAQKMFDQVCGVCVEGHGKSTVIWDRPTNIFKTITDVKKQIYNNTFLVALPVLKHKDLEWDKTFKNYFLPMMDHPGYFYLVQKSVGDTRPIFNALSHIAVVFIIYIILLIAAGILIWILETYWNEEEFPHTFIEGFKQGVWWAYITSTTVGYGDIAPRGILGRLFCVVWMLTSLVVLALVMAEIITSMMIASMEPKNTIPLKAKVGVLNNSEAHHYGVRQTMATITTYTSLEEMVEGIESGVLDGCLVDRYAAGNNQEQLTSLTLKSFLSEDDKKYGMMLSGRMFDKYTYNLFKTFMKDKQYIVAEAIGNNKRNFPEAEKKNIIDVENPSYQSALITIIGLLLVATVAGLVFDYGYAKPKHRKLMEMLEYNMVEDEEVVSRACDVNKMKTNTLYSMQDCLINLFKDIEHLNDKHEREQSAYKVLQLKVKKKEKKETEEMMGFEERKC